MLFPLFFILEISLLLLLALFVYKDKLVHIDSKILSWFHQLQTTTLDIFFSAITWLGSLWVIIPSLLGISISLFMLGYRTQALLLNIGFFGAVISTYALKFLFQRPRPDLFTSIDSMPIDPSFPSAHTTQVFIFALLLSLIIYSLNLSWKLPIIAVLLSLAVLVAISRIYLQVHFASDVLAGILVATLWATTVFYFIKKGVLS